MMLDLGATLAADELGHEARAHANDHATLKLWLRMLACTTQVETEVRRRLRARFGISLARFDFMAQLYRHRDGLRMKALSRCLMVTGGNVTGLADELEREALVLREPDADDRRSLRVRLTPKGRKAFEAMAVEHEAWILELFGDIDERTIQSLYQTLGALRARIAARDQAAAAN
ncbi:MAG: MarR family winged helix-turn-helix transcriptional regulator [Lautropia sp.]